MVRTPIGYVGTGFSGMGFSGYSSVRRGFHVNISYYEPDDEEGHREVESKRDVTFISCPDVETAVQTLIDNDVAHINSEKWSRHIIYTSQDIDVYGEDLIASKDFKPEGFTDAELKEIYIKVCHWMGREPKWMRGDDPTPVASPFIEHKGGSELPGVSRKRVVFDRLQEMDTAIADYNREHGERLPPYLVAEKLGIYEERERLLRERDDIVDEALAADPYRAAKASPVHQVHIEEQQQVFDAVKGRWEAAGEVEDRYINFVTGELACEWIIEHVIENPDVEVWYYDPYKPFIYILYSQQDSDKTKRLSCRLETIQGWEDFELRAASRIVYEAYRNESKRREDVKDRMEELAKAGGKLGRHDVVVLSRNLDRFDKVVKASMMEVVHGLDPWVEAAKFLSEFDIKVAGRTARGLEVLTKEESGPGPGMVHDKLIILYDDHWESVELSAIQTYLRNEEEKKVLKEAGMEPGWASEPAKKKKKGKK